MTHSQDLMLRIAASLWRQLSAFHLASGKDREALSYLWARCERTAEGFAVLAPADTPFFAFAADCYERQSSGNVRLAPAVLNGMLVEFARTDFNCLINVHDHWFADDARFSAIDDEDDARFECYLTTRFAPMLQRRRDLGPARQIHNVSIVLGRRSSSVRLMRGASRPLAARNLVVVDERWCTAPISVATGSEKANPGVWHSRHAGFMPPAVQGELGRLRVAVAGCGGLGSILAESLVRVGVRNLVLIDDDRLEASNLNRWQGAGPADVGQPKARLLAARVAAMAEDCSATALECRIDRPEAVDALAGSDVIVGGLDNDVARFFLAHVSLQYLVPYFDAGVTIEIGPPVDFRGRYFAVLPGVSGCIFCKGLNLVDRGAIADALVNPAVQAERRAAGYVDDTPDIPAPSAYLLNQRIAALAMTEFLNFIAGWRPTATVVSESWARGRIERLDRANFPDQASPDCPLCGLRIGRGSALRLPRRAAAGFLHKREIPSP